MLRFDYFFPAFAQITDMDTAGATKYYSYTTAKQYWLIQQWNTTTNTFRYIAGYGDYTVAWAGRGTQSYDYLYNVLS